MERTTGRVEEAGEWLEEFESEGTGGIVVWERVGVKGMDNELIVEVGKCITYWLVKCWQ